MIGSPELSIVPLWVSPEQIMHDDSVSHLVFVWAVVRLQKIGQRPSFRYRLKIDQKCFFLCVCGHFNNTKINDFHPFFAPDSIDLSDAIFSRNLEQEIGDGTICGQLMLFECTGSCLLSPVQESEIQWVLSYPPSCFNSATVY